VSGPTATAGGGYRRSASCGTLAEAIAEGKKEVWMDVGEEVTEILEVAAQNAMEERVGLTQVYGPEIYRYRDYNSYPTTFEIFSSFMPSWSSRPSRLHILITSLFIYYPLERARSDWERMPGMKRRCRDI